MSELLGHGDIRKHRPAYGESSSADTGFTELDRLMGGLRRGNLYLVAGRPGMGKSAFVLNVALNSLRASKPVYYFSPVISPEETVRRIISIMTGVETVSFRLRNLSDGEKSAVNTALTELRAMPLYICHTPFPEAEELASMLRTADRDGIAIIDDIQSVCWNKSRPFMPSIMDRDAISKISRELKLAAIDVGIPLLCTSRLSKELEHREDKHPLLSDLENTAGIMEYDADGVILMYRESYYRDTEDESKAELILAKNRWGSTGVDKVNFDPLSGRFSNIEE